MCPSNFVQSSLLSSGSNYQKEIWRCQVEIFSVSSECLGAWPPVITVRHPIVMFTCNAAVIWISLDVTLNRWTWKSPPSHRPSYPLYATRQHFCTEELACFRSNIGAWLILWTRDGTLQNLWFTPYSHFLFVETGTSVAGSKWQENITCYSCGSHKVIKCNNSQLSVCVSWLGIIAQCA